MRFLIAALALFAASCSTPVSLEPDPCPVEFVEIATLEGEHVIVRPSGCDTDKPARANGTNLQTR